MIGCLISIIIAIMAAAIFLVILELALGYFFPFPPQVVMLIRLLVGLLVLLWIIQCFFGMGGWPVHWGPR